MGCGASSQLNLDTAPTTDGDKLAATAATAAAKAAKLRRADPQWPAWKGSYPWNSKRPWTRGGGSDLEPLLRVDPELGGSPIALLDARFLVALAEQGGILRRRQDLPAEAFLDLPALQKMPGHGYDLRVFCVSYPWLQPDHPDPHAVSLRQIARILKKYLQSYAAKVPGYDEKVRGGTMAVFLDFCSLHQKDAEGKRTEQEAALFGRALSSLSELYVESTAHP
jgi:hypothetical protein